MRIGTAEIYAQVEQIPEVVEAICIGQDWENDVRVVLFVRLREGVTLDEALKERIRKQIRTGASPRHVPAKIVQVADIPRTRSGKITELAVRDVVHGRPVKNTEALANPEALALIRKPAGIAGVRFSCNRREGRDQKGLILMLTLRGRYLPPSADLDGGVPHQSELGLRDHHSPT